MAKKLRTRGHKVVLNRSAGGDAGITFMLAILGVIMFGSNILVKKALSKVGE